jgi:hypothetical protein
MRRSWLRLTSALPAAALLATLACDSDEGGRKDLEAAAAAALGTEKDKETKEREEKEAAERRVAFEKRQKEEAAVDAEFARLETQLVGLPDKPPKQLDKVCTDLIVIYEEWIKAIYFDDDGKQLTFFDSKSKNLGDVKGKCAKVGDIEAAACMIHVIQGVSAEGFPDTDKKLLQGRPSYMFDKCVTKYAPDYQPPVTTVESEAPAAPADKAP